MTENRTHGGIGAAVLRKEDDRLLRGRARFLDDVPAPEGTLHMAFVRSPHAHALIKSLDVAEAKALPGVVDVLSGADIAEFLGPIEPDVREPGFRTTERRFVCTDRVRFVGDIVAVVLAENPYVAEDAVELVAVDYEPLPAVASTEAALAPGAPAVHDGVPDNVVWRNTFVSKGFEEAFASADRVFTETFRSERVAVVSLEPRGCLAVWDPGLESLTIWTSTQIPHLVRTGITMALGCPETAIRVIAPDVGGGFGMKTNVYPEEFLAAALARKFQGAVKWVQDRQDDFLTSSQARDFVYRVELAVSNDGIFQAARIHVRVNIGAYPHYPFGSSLEAGGAPRTFPGPYKFQHYAFDTAAVLTHTCPTSAYRGVSAPISFFALEGMMDRVARALGMDPAEIRFKNLLKREDFPYVNANGVRYDTGTYVECLERALEIVDYKEYRRRQPASRLVDGKYRGIGIATITEQTGQGGTRYRARGLLRIPGIDSAYVKVAPTGKATVFVSHATQGQGHLTTFAQIAAEHLGMDVADVTVVEGDTALTPYGSGTFASRGAVTGGGAVIRAADMVREKICRIAAHLLEVSSADLTVRDGFVQVAGVPDMRISIAEVAKVAYSMSKKTLPPGERHGLEAVDYYDPPVPAIGNATHIACVAVDPQTGGIEIERYVVVHDCGRVINPIIVDGQTHGAVVQGLGPALMEQIVYDEHGQLQTTTLLDYVLPTILDVPDIELAHFETPALDTIGGIKGMAESGTIGAIPAIANAVADALADLNVSINRIPLRPSVVRELIDRAAAARARG